MKKLMYIVIFLLMAANMLAQESYVIDSICEGAERIYRMDGEDGSTYEWNIFRAADSSLYGSAVPYVDYEDINRPNVGDTTWGSEIVQLWDEVGEFDIQVLHWSEHGCDTVEQGRVIVFPPAVAYAGEDRIICELSDIVITGDSADNYVALTWESLGDGTFDNEFALHPTYYLGSNDSTANSVTIILTVFGLAQNGTCPPAKDTVVFDFSSPEISFEVTELLCYNDSSGQLIATVSDGVPPFTYEWEGPPGFVSVNSDSITGLWAGTYQLKVTDANYCVDSSSVELVNPPELIATIDSVKDVTCYDYADGFIYASAYGGTGELTFSWEGPNGFMSDSDTIRNLGGGVYTYTVTDENECFKTDSVVIYEPEPFLAEIDIVNNIACFGQNNGSAHVQVTNGVEPLTYSWNTSPEQVTDWAANLGPGEYIITLTDNTGCMAWDTVQIYEPPLLALTVDSLNYRCDGAKPGEIDIEITGGTPYANEPYYRYQWTNESGDLIADTEDLTGLEGNQSYTVVVHDSMNCEITRSVFIPVIEMMELQATVDSAVCFGDYWDIDITVTKGNPPYSFQWTDESGDVVKTTEDRLNARAGFHAVTILDSDSCEIYREFILEDPPEIDVNILTDDNTEICEDDIVFLEAKINGGTGNVLGWWTGNGADYLNSTNISTPVFADAPADNYQLIYTGKDESGCDGADTIEILVKPPGYSFDTVEICMGSASYEWNGVTILSDEDREYTAILENQNQFGCDSILSLLVNVVSPLNLDTTITVCENLPSFEVFNTTVVPGTNTIYLDTIRYQDSGCDSLLIKIEVETLPVSDTILYDTICEGAPEFVWGNHTISTFADSTYRDTLTNQWGCDSTLTYNVQITPVVKHPIPLPLCYGSTPELWFNQNISSETDSVYYHSLTSAAGCDSLLILEVNILPVTDTTLDTLICEGLPDFTWNNRTIVSTNDSVYLDTLINSYGCDSLLTYEVYIIPRDTVYETDTICFDDPTYVWNEILIETQEDSIYEATLTNTLGCDSIVFLQTKIINGIITDTFVEACIEYTWVEGTGETYTESGIYTHKIGGSGDCEDLVRLHLIISPEMKLNFTSSDVLCYGGNDGSITLTVDGGISPFTYNWNTGDVSTSIVGLTAGTYSVMVTDSIDCFIQDSIVIQQPDSIYIDLISVTNVMVAGDSTGSIDIAVSGGTPNASEPYYTYEWSDSLGIVGTSEDLNDIPAGIYTVKVTDANNCTSSMQVEVLEPTGNPEMEMLCPPAIELECRQELEDHPVYADYIAYEEAGGSVSSNCVLGVDYSSFAFIKEESDLETCPETITRYYTISDNCGLADTCSQQIIIHDLTPPELNCPPALSLKDTVAPAPYNTFDEFIAATGIATDNCGIVKESFEFLNVSISGTTEQVITRTYAIKDSCDNIGYCDHIIRIDYSESLVLTCPPTIFRECTGTEPGEYTSLDSFKLAGGDVFSLGSAVLDSTFILESEVSNGEKCPEVITRIYSIQNEAGQVATCEQLIIINDTERPDFDIPDKEYFTCEQDVRPYRDLNDLENQFRGNATFDDNCEVVRMEYIADESTESAGVCPKIYTRVYEVFDACGNSQRAVEEIKVWDVTPPVVKKFTAELIPDCEIPEPYEDYNAFKRDGGEVDDCNLSEVIFHLKDSTSTAESGKILRIYRFIDVCGNFTDTIQRIIVPVKPVPLFSLDPLCIDSEPPVLENISENGISGTWEPAAINTSVLGIFQFTFTPDVSECALDTTIEIEIYDRTTPTFVDLGPYCINSEAVALPDTSMEGISGSWSPAVINTSLTGFSTYTFTPDADECANPASIIIEIANEIVPVFAELGPYCQYSVADSLPLISTNNIRGTWNPAVINTDEASAQMYHFIADAGQCATDTFIEIVVTPAVELTEQHTNDDSRITNDGSIDLTINGGSAPFDIVWSNGEVREDIDELEAGNYSVVVTDVYGCVDSLSVLIHSNALGFEEWTLCENHDTIWNGISVIADSSRAYIDTLSTVAGYDSIVTLQVNILPVVFGYDTIRLCENIRYEWNNQLISTREEDSGKDYSFVTQSALGCDSVANLHVLISPVQRSISNMELCEGVDTIWNNIIINAYRDSSYTAILNGASSAGCDSIARVYVTILPRTYSYTTDTIFETEAPYEWNDSQYYFGGIYQHTLTNAAGCDSILTLDLTILGRSITNIDTTICAPDVPYEWHGREYFNSGTYSDTLEMADGGDSIVNLHLTIVDESYSELDTVICDADLPFLWLNKDLYESDTYIDTLPNVLGCDSIITLNLRVLPSVQTTVNWALCAGSPDTVWNGQFISGNTAGTYIDTMLNGSAMGCDSITILEVEILPINVFDSSVYACGSYLWDWGDNNTYTETGVYTTTHENLNGCIDTLRLNLVVSPEFDLQETHVDQGANPNPVGSIDLDIEGGTNPISISWTGPNGFTATTEDISGLYAGNYQVQVSDTFGCYDSLLVGILSVEPELVCLPDTVIECPDPSQYPAATNLAEFIAYGGSYKPENLIANIRAFELAGNRDSCLSIDRYYVIEDIYGRTDTCIQHVDFYDNIAPVIIAPPGDTAECFTNIFPPVVNNFADFMRLEGADAYDNCSIDPSTFTVRDTTIILNPGRAQVIYYYSIADFCGNMDRDTSYYLITDDQAPEVYCADITVYLDENGEYHLTIQDSITMVDSIYDNCTPAEDMRVEIQIDVITCEDVESGAQATVVVYDQSGRSGNCVANITVVDNLPPTAVCKDITVYLDETGVATITPPDVDDNSYDNCGIESYQITPDEFNCFDVGENIVTLIVTDYYGLRDTCESIVTVVDSVAPYIECRPVQTIQLDEYGKYELTWDMVSDSTWDECGVDTILLDDYELDCDNIGITTITAIAYDVNGNPGTCEATFEVFGNIPPNVVNDSAVTAMNYSVDIPVTNNDYDLKTNINIESLGILVGPAHGSVVVDKTTGLVTYTPDLDYQGPDIFQYTICDDGIPCEPACGSAIVYITVLPANNPPDAVDDYFEVPCGDLFGNVLYGDYFGNGVDSDPDGDAITINPELLTQPDSGVFNWLDNNGNFEYIPFDGFFGTDSFQYVICDNGLPSLCDTAWAYITRVPDNDCDGVADVDDIDDDNDGIRDNIENGGFWPEEEMGLIDSDNDGIPDYLDIDSDNDGIPDNIEGQAEHNYIPPTGRDGNGNGWDDAYDPENGGYPFDPEDTDGDTMPDYLDIDTDNDGVWDIIEGHDADHNGIADVLRWYSDEDRDGLDDAYDTYSGWADYGNEIGSNAPLQDFDGDGTRDWRDTNDEDDEYETVIEDLNGNGDYSDDDLDLDGYPEYLDTELNCELFIPEGFSPNDDGVHDFFQILCIQKYPNAKLMIFNRNGVKLWEKEHYGNLDVWGTYYDAWWWGTSENVLTIGRAGGLPAGNYIYVLILNDGLGTVKNGTVMLAY